MRLKIFRLMVCCGFLLILGTLVHHQVIQGEYYFRLSKNNRIRVVPMEARRGSIYDRDGRVLAESRLSYDAMVIPQDIRHFEELIAFLSRTLNVEASRLKRNYLNRKLSPFTPVVLAEDLTREQIFAIEEEKFRFPGLWVEQGYRREYPLGADAAHAVGYVGKISVSEREQLKEYGVTQLSVVGKEGIEKFYDHDLHGIGGGLQVEVNSRGEQVRVLGLRDAVAGNDLTLTLDARLQSEAARLLQDKNGAIVAMDTSNGEILALVSGPSFNPNHFGDRSKSDAVSSWFSDPDAPLLNRAVRGQFPPGSVFKVVMAIAALNERIVDLRRSWTCPGSYQLGNRVFRCTHQHGSQDILDSIAHSCNVYYYQMVQLMKTEQIHRYGQMFGLDKLTGIDLPSEEEGFLPSSWKKAPRGGESWQKGDLLNYSIGQGNLLSTPLQMTLMMAAVARRGIIVQPHLLKSAGSSGLLNVFEEQKLNIRSDVFDAVHKGLRRVVTDETGTARSLDIPGIYVAGKTGTAQSSGSKDHHAWFVGFARRADGREVVFCVFLEHGGSSYNAVVLSKELVLKMKELNLI